MLKDDLQAISASPTMSCAFKSGGRGKGPLIGLPHLSLFVSPAGISQSRISHWLLQQGSDLSEQKKRAFYRWYQLEKTNPGKQTQAAATVPSPLKPNFCPAAVSVVCSLCHGSLPNAMLGKRGGVSPEWASRRYPGFPCECRRRVRNLLLK